MNYQKKSFARNLRMTIFYYIFRPTKHCSNHTTAKHSILRFKFIYTITLLTQQFTNSTKNKIQDQNFPQAAFRGGEKKRLISLIFVWLLRNERKKSKNY